ncbi:MAG: hypothetical protein J5802_06530 [Butyrivibrio sp.]|nr:hypothetical protein [Butyrivibrio sp.]
MLGHAIVLVFGVCVALVWFAICKAKYDKWSRRKRECTQELTVKVVNVLERKTARGGMIYKPIFMPLDPAYGFAIDSAYYSNLVRFNVGDTVELLVNPNNMKDFIYKDDSLNKGKGVDMIACFLPLIVILLYVLLSKR